MKTQPFIPEQLVVLTQPPYWVYAENDKTCIVTSYYFEDGCWWVTGRMLESKRPVDLKAFRFSPLSQIRRP